MYDVGNSSVVREMFLELYCPSSGSCRRRWSPRSILRQKNGSTFLNPPFSADSIHRSQQPGQEFQGLGPCPEKRSKIASSFNKLSTRRSVIKRFGSNVFRSETSSRMKKAGTTVSGRISGRSLAGFLRVFSKNEVVARLSNSCHCEKRATHTHIYTLTHLIIIEIFKPMRCLLRGLLTEVPPKFRPHLHHFRFRKVV